MDFFAIIISVLTIAVLIIVHEFGHFLFAKMYGFQTPVFGIGLPFGPGINLFKKWDTQFKFYFALIGGFVAIPELGDETDKESLAKYENLKPLREFPVHQRAVVAFGGIAFNILFAFLLAIIMAACVGLPSAQPTTTVSAFSKDSPAQKAGLAIGDKVISIDDYQLTTAKELQDKIKATANTQITLLVERDINPDKEIEDIRKLSLYIKNPGALGIVLGSQKIYNKYPANAFIWIKEAFLFVSKTILLMFLSVFGIFAALFQKIIGIFVPNLEPAGVNLGDVKGIVGIVQIISQDIKNNATLLFDFAILLSLNLAVINLLPIPALDGGHLMFMAIEAITGKKPSEKFQESLVQIGFAFLMSAILITTFNDIKNWLFG
jgi:regulator of sigma E protease